MPQHPTPHPGQPHEPEPHETAPPRSAAEHCTAAEDLFVHARAIHPRTDRISAEVALEYERCLEWAQLHLRMADAITAGARLLAAHRHLLAQPDVRLHSTHLADETQQWTQFFAARHDTTARTT